MPLIKPRTRDKQFVWLITRLDRESNETLYAYAHFIGESAEYVLNQLVESLLAKDKGVHRVARGALRLVCATPGASASEAEAAMQADPLVSGHRATESVQPIETAGVLANLVW